MTFGYSLRGHKFPFNCEYVYHSYRFPFSYATPTRCHTTAIVVHFVILLSQVPFKYNTPQLSNFTHPRGYH